MNDNRNNQGREENTTTRHNEGNTQSVTDPSIPDNRLKDGTNDFQNGDQNETSQGTSDLDDKSKRRD